MKVQLNYLTYENIFFKHIFSYSRNLYILKSCFAVLCFAYSDKFGLLKPPCDTRADFPIMSFLIDYKFCFLRSLSARF